MKTVYAALLDYLSLPEEGNTKRSAEKREKKL